MTTYNYIFLYRGEPIVFQDGDIARVDTIAKTISFSRNNEWAKTIFDKDNVHIENIDSTNACTIIQEITNTIPVLDTNDSTGDILIFKLTGKIEEVKK